MKVQIGDLPIQRKFLLANLLLTLSALVIISGFLIANEWRNFRNARFEEAETVASMIAANSGAALIYDDPATARQILTGIRSRPGTVAAALYRANGQLYEHFPTNLPHQLVPATPSSEGTRMVGKHVHVFEDVVVNGRRVGVAYVQIDVSAAYRRFSSYLVLLATIGAACVGVVILLSKLLQRWISRPVLDLSNTARRIAFERNYSLRAQKFGSDEVGVLVDAFNHMVSEIQGAQERLQLALTAGGMGAWEWNIVTDRITWSPSVEAIHGLQPGTFGQRLGDFKACLHREDLDTVMSGLNEALQNRADYHATYRISRPDNTVRWVEAFGQLTTDSNGLPRTLAGVCLDITERKAAEEALRENAERLERAVAARTRDLKASNEQLEAFVYSIAHDLRAPLRTVTGYAQLLLEDHAAALDDTARHLLERMSASSQFMDRLLLDLLAYGRAARADVELGPVDVERAWNTALFQCAAQIEQTQARIEAAGPFPIVRAHEATLGQCLANLVGNALKFVPAGVQPHIRFRSESREDHARLWVEDNGVGIPAELHERVFRVFERLHGSRYPGTGIGLSIVRKAVERMGGNVGLESSAGRGSRFWIELPILRAESPERFKANPEFTSVQQP